MGAWRSGDPRWQWTRTRRAGRYLDAACGRLAVRGGPLQTRASRKQTRGAARDGQWSGLEGHHAFRGAVLAATLGCGDLERGASRALLERILQGEVRGAGPDSILRRRARRDAGSNE